jgi:Rrf2 family transcriptional regulator, cysteine metabolism repressor
MRISSKSEYGVRALFELAQCYGQPPVQSGEIAERQNIPEAYLNQLLISLRKAGLVRSLRGPQGGHQLARPPAQITVAEIVGALEGPTSIVEALRGRANHTAPEAIISAVWVAVQEAIDGVLTATTLETLLDRKREYEATLSFQI